MQIILGSNSPRRKDILNFFSLPFIQVNSNFDESKVDMNLTPQKYTKEIAIQKAISLSQKYPKSIIITADTVVYFKNKYLLKPKNRNEAKEMLKMLSGNMHEVFSGICVKTPGKIYAVTEKTKVYFNNISDKEIDLYHQTFEFHDKAGGYAIQKGGTILVKKITGCFYNVMGLPINSLRKLLKKAGIELWHFLKPL